MSKNSENVKNKQRSIDYGEVNTSNEIVTKMANLVEEQCSKFDSRFLEPACGDGNFLCEILVRKLSSAYNHYPRQEEFEKYSLVACSSLYGIDLLSDNVELAIARLCKIFEEFYRSKFSKFNEDILKCFKKIVSRNIVQGDALNFKCGEKLEKDIILSEWSLIGNSFKIRDFKYSDFISYAPIEGDNLFSDFQESTFIPTAVKDYPLIKYDEIHKRLK